MMKIALSGGSGLIGSALAVSLRDAGHEVIRMVRRNVSMEDDGNCAPLVWDPQGGHIEVARLDGVDAMIHLAGEPISQRWTAEKKREIRNSRVEGTRTLANAILAMKRPPQVWINASAIGYYGDRGAELLDENSRAGTGFLAETCQAWEAAAEPAAERGVRVVCLRTGIVLSRSGGALAKMLPPFRLGLGGILGSGRQYMSWIALEDQVSIIHHLLENDSLAGPVNAVAPNPVTNREYTKALGKVLARPTVFPMPAFAVKLAFGEMGEQLLLSSARVRPQRLLTGGFHFRFPELDGALHAVLSSRSVHPSAVSPPREAHRVSVDPGKA